MTIDDQRLAEAAALLSRGGLVAFPTETVYGLGADATRDDAVARIFAAKQRPSFNPLIVHVGNIADADGIAVLSPRALELASAFWPGPLTLVLKRHRGSPISLLVSAGLDTIAIRVPAHPLARRLLAAAGRPVAAPSANRSGRLSPTTAAHVRSELGDLVDVILDGGSCTVGVESTIIDLSGGHPTLLRPGGIALEAIAAIIGPLAKTKNAEIRAPGMLASHYAPVLPLRLEALDRRPGEAFVAFGRTDIDADAQLSATGDTTEAAAKLFATLRDLDREPFDAIGVMPIPELGLGVAINDRLRRAAAPRA
jgi:L-threonylcarbamoyladenylate synthase